MKSGLPSSARHPSPFVPEERKRISPSTFSPFCSRAFLVRKGSPPQRPLVLKFPPLFFSTVRTGFVWQSMAPHSLEAGRFSSRNVLRHLSLPRSFPSAKLDDIDALFPGRHHPRVTSHCLSPLLLKATDPFGEMNKPAELLPPVEAKSEDHFPFSFAFSSFFLILIFPLPWITPRHKRVLSNRLP